VFYHLIHAVVLLVVGLTPRVSKAATICFGLGILLFSGSLYVLALTGIAWLGAITPVGGLCFLLGWAALSGRLGMSWRVEESERLEREHAAAEEFGVDEKETERR
jgi:uncharacterized membrane protein YgdD (TMEM256/DUF423 family)